MQGDDLGGDVVDIGPEVAVLGHRLVLRPGQPLSLEELVAFLRGFEIATFKLPERAAFFDTLPLSGFGKVSKKDLAAHVAEGL